MKGHYHSLLFYLKLHVSQNLFSPAVPISPTQAVIRTEPLEMVFYYWSLRTKVGVLQQLLFGLRKNCYDVNKSDSINSLRLTLPKVTRNTDCYGIVTLLYELSWVQTTVKYVCVKKKKSREMFSFWKMSKGHINSRVTFPFYPSIRWCVMRTIPVWDRLILIFFIFGLLFGSNVIQ